LQLLTSEFRIRCDIPDVLARLSDAVVRARQDQPIQFRLDWQIDESDDGYCLTDASGAELATLTSLTASAAIRNRMIGHAVAGLPQHAILRAALGHHAGKGFLLVGGRDTGKTTLAIALLQAGFEVSGDELVLLRDGQGIAMPRRFQYWESTRDLLPDLPPYQGQPLLFGDRSRQLLSSIDPIDLGRDWHIRPVPVAAVFCIDTNFGGRSTLRRCTARDALPYVLPQSGSPTGGDPGWVARLYALLDRSHTAILSLGSLDEAIRWIRIALDQIPPAEGP
jgi:hypothetical protein